MGIKHTFAHRVSIAWENKALMRNSVKKMVQKLGKH